MSGATKWVKKHPLESIGILAATVATGGAAAPLIGGTVAGAATAGGAMAGAAPWLATTGAMGAMTPAVAAGAAPWLAATGPAGAAAAAKGGSVSLLSRLGKGVQAMNALSPQEQEQPQSLLDPRSVPQAPQRPLAIPGGSGPQADLMSAPMNDEERKWRMLLAQLQGGQV